MSRGRRSIPFVGALLLVAAGQGEAQGGFALEGQGGVGIPVGALEDLVRPGPTLGLGLAYWFHPQVAIRIDGDAELLRGRDLVGAATPRGPDIDIFHYGAGLQFEFTNPWTSRWEVTVNAGGGGTTLDSEEFLLDVDPEGEPLLEDFRATYFHLYGGIGIGVELTRHLHLFLDGQWYLVMADEEETSVLTQASPDLEEGFDTASSIPLTLGIRLRTN